VLVLARSRRILILGDLTDLRVLQSHVREGLRVLELHRAARFVDGRRVVLGTASRILHEIVGAPATRETERQHDRNWYTKPTSNVHTHPHFPAVRVTLVGPCQKLREITARP